MNNKIILGLNQKDTFYDELSSVLDNYNLVYCDHSTILEELEKEDISALIIDAFMPDIDAEYIIEYALEKKINIGTIIVLSPVHQDKLVSRFLNLNVDYVMIKPFNVNLIKKRIEASIHNYSETSRLTTTNSIIPTKLYTKKNNIITKEPETEEEQLSKYLAECDIRPHLKGYSYIRDAILIKAGNPGIQTTGENGLYDRVALEHNSTASRVERAIRHAIEVAWKSDNNRFKTLLDIHVEKPRNGELISFIADKINLSRKQQNN